MNARLLTEQLDAVLEGSVHWITALSNASAVLYEAFDRVNWTGFYLLEDDRLILGPFQGKTACMLIPMGKGVCGHAAQLAESVVVPDVHAFPGHIACDSASRSEIVIPLRHADGRVFGVLDIDSPQLSRFEEGDRVLLEQCADSITARLEALGFPF